jgi:hypothetical protein
MVEMIVVQIMSMMDGSRRVHVSNERTKTTSTLDFQFHNRVWFFERSPQTTTVGSYLRGIIEICVDLRRWVILVMDTWISYKNDKNVNLQFYHNRIITIVTVVRS